ncbi:MULTISPECIES: protein phosphatase 2C domain-containing protein [unclassified Actinomyces]|uniref:PP2C family protein-serine/threonine phosphatase n=2 Tax=Actinomyces TaxID=1654 RepID=UPI002017987E|nr:MULTISPECIES: protein phosphatase 2C domain-containing protein [unclassified Actinomyces]MCL3777802.1 serine/threonine-protein phosphatase [Actinomyces sp. AC-20-1]MCL3790928.1 serine/threonine-protein phosphatase [Actinomyces sp. 187325]MCL3793195.1 serine/threonine-protein phosphatase [Actinomyces sp. 186855]MCL3795589.1 serine/threonine-protein phosphatase [Actinomyces sp. 217892]
MADTADGRVGHPSAPDGADRPDGPVAGSAPRPGDLVPLAGAATDVGRLRRVNEDGYLALAPAFVVVDGMGGHSAGRAAARAALSALRPLGGTRVTGAEQVVEAVREAAVAVTAIPSQATHRPGATVAGVVLAHVPGTDGDVPTWVVLNIGDARVYLLRDGALTQVSHDHSQVQELVDAGRLTPAAARRDPRRNIVTRALGGGIDDDGVPALRLLPAAVADRLLVCSDGLSDELDDDELAVLLGAGLSPQRTAEAAVAAALEHGGHDNVTALVIDVPGSPAPGAGPACPGDEELRSA